MCNMYIMLHLKNVQQICIVNRVCTIKSAPNSKFVLLIFKKNE